MEEQDRNAIAARHPHHELAQDWHAKAPVIATRRSASPRVRTAMRPNWFRFENDTGGCTALRHSKRVLSASRGGIEDIPLLAETLNPQGITRLRGWDLNPRQTD